MMTLPPAPQSAKKPEMLTSKKVTRKEGGIRLVGSACAGEGS